LLGHAAKIPDLCRLSSPDLQCKICSLLSTIVKPLFSCLTNVAQFTTATFTFCLTL
jgi:hypothetical protein